MNATTNTIEAGTIVRAPRVVATVSTGVRKGLVVDTFGDSAFLVWFYGAGDAKTETRLVMKREMTEVGSVGDLSERMLSRLLGGMTEDGPARAMGFKIHRLRAQLRSARRGY
ncbi:hypothetical protein SAM23877_6173 [Streptomyces ambofaciens ATCC 23877]|uniref:Uncharacterized protein n=1 Tax=Streptomyces ambofaciens (strain ATCC 23877 / 3486 / DSM 40053 / JCM 4204 / NBRC 12836 / NRRL B-2516) TaxID=278992 RepID=A0A0K2B1Y7_STRA7|nr:DUF6409 family protein [Streptomyces ambofaciens]AKZ59218.1 hypothetical protein SAM23877_6173 [Streptomyces ambofaciens ATCC 23877]WNA15413.1 hypothetical protein SAMYPH_82 [Streptomyces phage Samy]